jgi:uncharacterized delta-60 repeat protein
MTGLKQMDRDFQRNTRGIIILICIWVLLFSTHNQAGAAGGMLDVTFGNGGKVVTDFSHGSDVARGVAVQSNGKIVVGGSSNIDFALARYNTDGSLDATFGTNGRVITDFFGDIDAGGSVALQADGKILMAGGALTRNTSEDFALTRYNSDGSLDLSFGISGKLTTDFFGDVDHANSVALCSDGKIIAAGRSFTDQGEAFAMVRYKTNGELDAGFGSGGKVITRSAGMNIVSIVIQPDGKIVASGNPGFTLVRYNIDGTLDPSFGTGGIETANINGAVNAIALQTNGKIVAAGSMSSDPNGSNVDFALLRFNANGDLDTNFGTNGMVTIDFNDFDVARAVAIQSDGRIVAAGQAGQGSIDHDFAVARLESNGSLDPTFGQGGKLLTDFSGELDIAWALVLQRDGKILAVGDSIFSDITARDFALARYDGGGLAFDTCIQGDSGGSVLRFNATTGDYQFTNCSGFSVSGTGVLINRGGTITLQHYASDRRVLARIETNLNKGTASIQLFSPSISFTITDRYTVNSPCVCTAD